jgi:phospholipid/cholesterol/gamma-HCH transport system ATP-binding protein
MIVAQSLTKSFDDRVVLDGVDIHIAAGQVLGIIGRGGGGKSVLLKLICGLQKPDEGTVLVDGLDLNQLQGTALAELRNQFGLLFQNNALFDFMTVGENVGFPLAQLGVLNEAEIEARVATRLAEVNLPGIEMLLPSELSGGMRKRVALARATIAEPPILLYDDPTAGLDPVTSSKIFKLIARLHKDDGVTVIVGHDVDRMRAVCTHWILLHKARVHFYGSTQDALTSSEPIVHTYFHGAEASE